MNFDEQNEEFRKLRLYILQINRCIKSKSRKIKAAWLIDKDFEQHVISAINLIENDWPSVKVLLNCSHYDFSILSKADRQRLSVLSRRIRELDELTEQDLFVNYAE